MTLVQRRLILNSFRTSHFSYCLTEWMFHSRKLNARINHVHERALRIFYKDFKSSFQELLIKDNCLNIHHRILQKLATEIFKVKKKTREGCFHTPYEQIDISGRGGSAPQRCFYVSSYLGPKLWNLVTNEYETVAPLADFNEKIEAWVTENCPC